MSTKINKTNAARLLDKAKIAYQLIPYEVDESDLSAVHALAKKYKSTSGYYAIAAVAFGVAGYGCYKSLSDKLSETVAAIGTVCFGVAIGCTIAAVVYHHKAGKELKLSVKGATACLVYTF